MGVHSSLAADPAAPIAAAMLHQTDMLSFVVGCIGYDRSSALQQQAMQVLSCLLQHNSGWEVEALRQDPIPLHLTVLALAGALNGRPAPEPPAATAAPAAAAASAAMTAGGGGSSGSARSATAAAPSPLTIAVATAALKLLGDWALSPSGKSRAPGGRPARACSQLALRIPQ